MELQVDDKGELSKVKRFGRAIVIGGSMAGLAAARVLSDHFDEVVILERDRYPDDPNPRKGLPQARHVHVLLWLGQMGLEKLFPGLQQELGQYGAPSMDWLGDSRWFMAGRWVPKFKSGYITHHCSRDLLEWCIRKRLAVLP